MEDTMKYILLIFQGTTPLPGSERWEALSDEERQDIYTAYAQLSKAPGVTPGQPLGLPTAARTVRIRDGKVEVKNGPHLQEGAGGYLEFEADNMEEAIEFAARIPAARLGGAIEIRPAEQYW